MNELSWISALIGLDTDQVIKAAGTKRNFPNYNFGIRSGGH